ncbi:hypothetical protein PUNSTDRAFT_45889 [Punctularia strigosozonata HHB-11173 SS5]|uniref:uncharacterized protein n=1 Tax=Punctularia strigosozonata (strain HHB-11173) TaxID=741275 RepID=UPI000441761A|nr:uncharacterized protein PUNSTDRAFT_45889 [Punctularia strigosozonata HHB-11173 SS5]EIN07529.1 hypothetical protein PUNSTDRAFT_45889 [Punctularia strigosozonata HHB-11173 SS5]
MPSSMSQTYRFRIWTKRIQKDTRGVPPLGNFQQRRGAGLIQAALVHTGSVQPALLLQHQRGIDLVRRRAYQRCLLIHVQDQRGGSERTVIDGEVEDGLDNSVVVYPKREMEEDGKNDQDHDLIEALIDLVGPGRSPTASAFNLSTSLFPFSSKLFLLPAVLRLALRSLPTSLGVTARFPNAAPSGRGLILRASAQGLVPSSPVASGKPKERLTEGSDGDTGRDAASALADWMMVLLMRESSGGRATAAASGVVTAEVDTGGVAAWTRMNGFSTRSASGWAGDLSAGSRAEGNATLEGAPSSPYERVEDIDERFDDGSAIEAGLLAHPTRQAI